MRLLSDAGSLLPAQTTHLHRVVTLGIHHPPEAGNAMTTLSPVRQIEFEGGGAALLCGSAE